jgi:hypothetical protein
MLFLIYSQDIEKLVAKKQCQASHRHPFIHKIKKKKKNSRAYEYLVTPIQWVPGALSLGAKRPGREADHSPPSSVEVKECVELYIHSPIRLQGVVLS